MALLQLHVADQTAELPGPLRPEPASILPPGTCPLPSVVPSASTERRVGEPPQSSPTCSRGLQLPTKRQVCAEQMRATLVGPESSAD